MQMPRRIRSIQLYASVGVLPLQQLRAQGIEALLVDLDGTLLSWNDMVPTDDIIAWARQVKDAGFRAIIVSNNHPARVTPIADALGFEALYDAGKPLPFAFQKAARILGVPHSRCAVIGDQLMTDMLGGLALGMKGYLVNPLPGREYWGTRINRIIERALMWLFGLKRPL